MAGKILIIGNGFDLDVNFKTKYKDYYEIWERNNFWLFQGRTDGLGGYINTCAKTDKWLDLEKALFDYAAADNGAATRLSGGDYPIDSDKFDFETLVDNLTRFIIRIPEGTKIEKKSVASQVLRAVLDNGSYSIYSFNYTNLCRVAARLYLNVSSYDDIEYDLSYTPVHGRVKEKDIILGVHSDADLIEGYDFLKKINQPQYHQNNLIQDLDSADEIVFFGLSMGVIDFPYFRDLFNGLCTGIVPVEKKKKLTFFTYDEPSRMDIHRQLSKLTGTDLMRMKNNCFMEFIRTENFALDDKTKLEAWIACQKSIS